MPLYDYKCPEGHKFTAFAKVAEYQSLKQCPECAQDSERYIAGAPAVLGDYPGYNCPITGDWVEGRKAHEANLKKHGCRVLESGEHQQNIARGKAEEEALEESIAATAEEFVATLPAQKREQLAAEIDNGADITVERQ